MVSVAPRSSAPAVPRLEHVLVARATWRTSRQPARRNACLGCGSRPHALVTALACALLAFTAQAAQAQALDLQWIAPRECVDQTRARAAIDALTQHDDASDGGRDGGTRPRTRAQVHIEASASAGYSAQVTLERGESRGVRKLKAQSCAALADAVILIIAMVIDPERASERASQTRAHPSGPSGGVTEGVSDQPDAAQAPADKTQASTTEAERAATPPAQRTPAQPTPAQPSAPASDEQRPVERLAPQAATNTETSAAPLRGSLALQATGDAGSLPSATLAFGAAAALAWRPFRLELAGLAFLPQRTDAGPAQRSRALIELYTGTLRGCVEVLGSAARSNLAACIAAELGLSTGTPRGASNGARARGLWGAGLLGAEGRIPIAGPLQLGLLAEAGVPIFRPNYEFDGFGRVFRAAPVLGRLTLRAVLLFP